MNLDLRSRAIWGFILVLMCCGSCSCHGSTEPNDDDGWPPAGRTLDGWPRWCPADTNKIGYTHLPKTYEELLKYGYESVWIVDVATGECQHIAQGWLADWFPEGERVLISRGEAGAFIRYLDTGEEEALAIFSEEADVSPSGNIVAYIGSGVQSGLWVMDLDALGSRWVGDRMEFDWSPDGEELLCDSLVILRLDGSRVDQIPYDSESGLPHFARWSPNGERVAYGAYCARQSPGVWVINVNGSSQTCVACPGARPSWCGNGRRIAFSARTEENITAIWMVNADGTGRTQVTFP